MNPSTTCPSPEVLSQVANATLEDASMEEVLAHVERCDDCTAGLRTLAAVDSGLPLQNAEAPASDAEAVSQLMALLRANGPTDARPAALSTWTTMAMSRDDTGPELRRDSLVLQPPAEELGRIGPYRLLRELGQGGMGIVYEAEDTTLHRRVALKVMQPSCAVVAAARQRFLIEARATAATEHDNIVVIHQVGEYEGLPYLAMQLLRGESLASRLEQAPRLPVSESLRIAMEIARGLAAAHGRGLLHRDIKPANIWLEEQSDRVKILDFGLVRDLASDQRLTQSGGFVGTPAYMSPEQVENKPVDARSDLFGLGCVLYRMLTGVAPFAAETLVGTLTAVCHSTPPAIESLNPQAPPDTVRLVKRLLAKNPDDRPKRAQEVAEELQRILKAYSGSPSPVVTSDVVRTKRRWPMALAAAAAMMALACGIMVTVKDKNGRTLMSFVVPNGSRFEFEDGSQSPPPIPLPEPPPRPAASPFDALDPAAIPEIERYPWQPKEHVAMFGSHRWRCAGEAIWLTLLPGGKQIKVRSGNAVTAFDLDSGRIIPAPGSSQYHFAAVSTDGRRMIDPDGLWEFHGGEAKLVDAPFRKVEWGDFSADGSRVITLGQLDQRSGFTARVWDVTPENRLAVVAEARGAFHAALAPHGKSVAYARASDGVVEVHDLVNGEFKRTHVLASNLGDLASYQVTNKKGLQFLSNNRLITLDRKGALTIWQLSENDAKPVAAVSLPGAHMFAVSHDGSQLCLLHQALARLYDIHEKTLVERASQNLGSYGHGGNLLTAAFLQDGKTLITGHNSGAVRLWDLSGATLVERDPLPFQPCTNYMNHVPRLSPDGAHLLTVSETNRFAVWEFGAQSPHDVSPGTDTYERSGYSWATLSRDGRSVFHLQRADSFRVWQLPTPGTGRMKDPLPFEHNVVRDLWHIAAPSRDLIVASGEATITVHRLAEGKFAQVASVPFEHDPRLFTFAEGGKTLVCVEGDGEPISLWNLADNGLTRIATIPVRFATSLAVSPDGQMLAVGSGYENGVFLWTLRDGQPTRPDRFDAGQGDRCVAFDPQGRRLVIGDELGALAIWDVASGRQLHEIQYGRPLRHVLWAPDGRHLITTNMDGTIYVLRLPKAVGAENAAAVNN